MAKALEEITKEATDTARLCMKEKRSFTPSVTKILSVFISFIFQMLKRSYVSKKSF